MPWAWAHRVTGHRGDWILVNALMVLYYSFLQGGSKDQPAKCSSSSNKRCAAQRAIHPCTPLEGHCKPTKSCSSTHMHATALPPARSSASAVAPAGGCGRDTSFHNTCWPFCMAWHAVSHPPDPGGGLYELPLAYCSQVCSPRQGLMGLDRFWI